MRKVRFTATPGALFSSVIHRRIAAVLAAATFACGFPMKLAAQENVGGRDEVFAGSILESYLRYMQSLGKADFYPMSIRTFSPGEIDAMAIKDSAHPWVNRFSLQRDTSSGLRITPIRATVGLTFNTAFPYGGNDGVVWAGKGLTSSVQLGVAVRWGPFSARLAPIAFRAENSQFPLFDNGQVGLVRFNDGQYPFVVDKPQRFGNDPYSRIDWGESNARIDIIGLTAGISSESQWWGPTNDFPYIIGNNSGGFPHVFFGTAKPANAGIVKLHGKVEYGMLDQSPYSPVTGPDYFTSFFQPGKRRFMAGLVGVMEVKGAPGLEIGGSRFFHAASTQNGITAHNLALPIQNLFKRSLPSEGTGNFGDSSSVKENQLASLWFRWAPPGSGFDVYGEFGREDFAADLRDLILEPEHSASTNLGFRKSWMDGTTLNAIRAEGFSYEASSGSRTRGEGQTYIHGTLFQGHTNRGQMLGANVGPGSGSAQTLAYDRFTPGGRMTAFFSRVTQHEQAGNVLGATSTLAHAVDVMNSLGYELGRFVGPFDISGRVVFTDDLNRNFLNDVSNATFGLTVSQSF
jgi:hypothetical protein